MSSRLQKEMAPFDAGADLRQQQSCEHAKRKDMRAAPHGWTVAPVHTRHKYKGRFGFLAQTQSLCKTVVSLSTLCSTRRNTFDQGFQHLHKDFVGVAPLQYHMVLPIHISLCIYTWYSTQHPQQALHIRGSRRPQSRAVVEVLSPRIVEETLLHDITID
ncbi:hypothetical protein INR49_016067 [Caranx melampygus]|nr:hypothetical protein INR49_016067 [Caranx melampygus]